MREHLVTCDVSWITRDMKTVSLDAICHVVVLAAPAPENIAEAVHQLEVFARHRGHAAKEISVR